MLLASFRPTPRQAVGRGLYLGAWFAGLLFVVAIGLHVTGALAPALDSPLAVLAVVALPPVLGGAGALVLRGRRGIEADATGVRQLGRVPAAQSWPGVSDVRAERHGGRIEVRAYLDGGAWVRLSAPYDGRLLAHDPGFENKYLTLRQVWEANRSWNIPGPGAAPGVPGAPGAAPGALHDRG